MVHEQCRAVGIPVGGELAGQPTGDLGFGVRRDVPDQKFLAAAPLELQRTVWPTEDFELAQSRVPVSLPEDDLFAGVRAEVAA